MSTTITTTALLLCGVLFLLISPLVNLSLTAAAGQTEEGRVRPRIPEDVFRLQ
jgi:hypothetical protein